MIRIQDIIIWILFLLSVIIFFWYLFGDSPTFEQAILVLSLTFLFTISLHTISNKTRLDLLERRFNNLVIDFKKYVMDKNGYNEH